MATKALNHSIRVRAVDFEQAWFISRVKEMGLEIDRIHRKIWEFAVIAQVFKEYRRSSSEVRCLGFGCGKEPLPKWFLDQGANVVVSDAPGDDPKWVGTSQHAKSLSDLGIDDKSSGSIEFLQIDMNAVPSDLLNGQFDFTWSAGSFEHIGGIEKSILFFCNQMRTLKPGGLACHTTEFNYESQFGPNFTPLDPTINADDLCLLRYRDLADLAGRLWLQGDRLWTPDLTQGDNVADLFVDTHPYKQFPYHLNIQIGEFKTTSVVLIAERGGEIE